MELILNLPVKTVRPGITHDQKILLLGSCFTEHIGAKLSELKFSTLLNPNGIVYDPFSIARHIRDYISERKFEENDLVERNGLWFSWDHHSAFSGTNKTEVLERINSSISKTAKLIRTAEWLIISPGTAFVYSLKSNEADVSNCHKVPAADFNKRLAAQEEITSAMQGSIALLKTINPGIRIIITVSPVRHIKDGVIENNRSKARLIEMVHSLIAANENVFYFPAYEIIIDILRDYRFYDEDMVHPNELAIKYVFEKFSETYFDRSTQELNASIENLLKSVKHKPFQAASSSHQAFIRKQIEIATALCAKYPGLDLEKEINSLKAGLNTGK